MKILILLMLIFCLACFPAVLHCPWLREKLSWLRLVGLMQLVTRVLSVFYWRSVIQAGLLSPPMSGTGLPSPVLSQEPARLGLVFKCIVCDFLAANPFFSVLASSPALPEIQRKSPVFSLLHKRNSVLVPVAGFKPASASLVSVA